MLRYASNIFFVCLRCGVVFFFFFEIFIEFLGASQVAQMVKNLPAIQEIWVQSLGW